MLTEDCREFVAFVQNRDPIVVVPFRTNTPAIHVVHEPCDEPRRLCFWNRALLPSLEYTHVTKSDCGPYYRAPNTTGILEFIRSAGIDWNGRPALLQGRIYTPFEVSDAERRPFAAWYDALGRWMRKHWVKNPVPHMGGCIGRAAFQAYKQGMILLPMFEPPLTSEWLSWSVAQESLRREM